MNEKLKEERQRKKKKRQLKRMRSTVVAFTLLLVLTTVGVVNAQTQGYEIFYEGKSIGTVRSMSAFNLATEQVEKEIQENHQNLGISFKESFEVVQKRIENPMDLETCIKTIRNAEVKLKTKGVEVFVNDKSIGVLPSIEDENRLLDIQEKAFPNIELHFEEKTAFLSETRDVSNILNLLKELEAKGK